MSGISNPLAMQGLSAQPSATDMQGGQMDGPPTGGTTPAPSAGSPSQIEAAYEKLREARGKMDVIQNVLGDLVSRGTNVTPDDVVDSAGKIVAAGVAPEGMAAMLAEMPEQPELLASWLAQHKETIDQKEAQLDAVTTQVQHQMGVQGLRQLMGQHQEQQEAQQAPDDETPVSGPSGNQLGI